MSWSININPHSQLQTLSIPSKYSLLLWSDWQVKRMLPFDKFSWFSPDYFAFIQVIIAPTGQLYELQQDSESLLGKYFQ